MKSKPQQYRADDTTALAVGSLPTGWVWSKVAEIGEVRLGRQRSPAHHSGPHMRPYLRVANVFEDRIDLSDVMEMNFTPAEFEQYQLRYGDILLNEGQSLEWVGRPAMYRDDLPGACFTNSLVRFRPHNCVDGKFALLVFRHFVSNRRFQKIARWTVNIAHLGAGRFAEVEFPVPPLCEQERIVARAEELFSDLDAGVAALERAKAKLKRYRAAVLKAAVDGSLTADWRAAQPNVESAPKLLERILAERRKKWEAEQLARFAAAGKEPPKGWKAKYIEPSAPDTRGLPELPKGWCWASVEQLAEVGTGTTPSRSRADYYENGTIPWVMSSAVNDLCVFSGSESVTELAILETALRVYPQGTLLLALYGEGKTRGKVAELRIDATINQALAALVMAQTAEMCRPYTKLFLQGNYERLRRKSAGGLQPNLNLSIVKRIVVPLAPLAEQDAIALEADSRLSIVMSSQEQIEASLARASRLRQSILKQAFEGKLVPQDPSDEPASVLLERIKAQKAEPITPARPRPRNRKQPEPETP